MDSSKKSTFQTWSLANLGYKSELKESVAYIS